MDLTKSILTKEQQAFGLTLHDDEDLVTLTKGDRMIKVFSTSATIESIRHAADQVIQESKSGVVIEKVA